MDVEEPPDDWRTLVEDLVIMALVFAAVFAVGFATVVFASGR